MTRSNNFVVNVFSQVLSLFDRVYTEFGAWSLLIGAFLVFTIYRLILAPIVGGGLRSGSSDTVKKVRKDKGGDV